MATNQMGLLASGQRVVDRYQSHFHPEVQAVLSEALSKISLSGEQFQVVQVYFDRMVGESTCVVTGPNDLIVYAQRPRRFGLSRFVKNRMPEPSSSVVIILKKADDLTNTYVLITAFIGEKPEPEPWDRNKTEKSVQFWSTHALVWGTELVIPGTEVEICPW